MLSYSCETPIGPLFHHWSEDGLYRVEIVGSGSARSNDLQGIYAQTGPYDFGARVEAFFEGQLGCFDDVSIDQTEWSPFFRDVYRECRRIDPGETISYSELARRAGRPAAARAVGSAMARNRIPIVIPCHRVVGSSGKLTGFSAPGGLDTKRWLLDMESGSGVSA